MRARTGKIARLPEKICEELNRRLLDGARGAGKDSPLEAGWIVVAQRPYLVKARQGESDLLGAFRSYDHRGRGDHAIKSK